MTYFGTGFRNKRSGQSEGAMPSEASMTKRHLRGLAMKALAAWLVLALFGSWLGSGWLMAMICLLLAVGLAKALRHRRQATASHHQYGQFHSPRAAMERQWSRLGSARGRLLADADRQSEFNEMLLRLEDRPQLNEAQAYDLQMPGMAKRKRKPKRQRFE